MPGVWRCESVTAVSEPPDKGTDPAPLLAALTTELEDVAGGEPVEPGTAVKVDLSVTVSVAVTV